MRVFAYSTPESRHEIYCFLTRHTHCGVEFVLSPLTEASPLHTHFVSIETRKEEGKQVLGCLTCEWSGVEWSKTQSKDKRTERDNGAAAMISGRRRRRRRRLSIIYSSRVDRIIGTCSSRSSKEEYTQCYIHTGTDRRIEQYVTILSVRHT